MSNISKTSKIELNVHLDEGNIPAKIEWMATDSPSGKAEEAKAFFLSLWDGEKKEDKNIHLWTNDMTIEEMNHFFFRSMMLMSETYAKATGNQEEMMRIREFIIGFGQRNKVLKEG